MRFWDSSAVVPLLVAEPASAEVLAVLTEDPQVVAWWSTETECASAIARLERDRRLTQADATAAFRRLDAIAASWQEVQPVPAVRRTATRLLRVHALRAGDALQLAAALLVADGQPATLSFVTRDLRLGGAAEVEGFPVLLPSGGA